MKEQKINGPITTTKEIALLAINDMCEAGVDTRYILPAVAQIVTNNWKASKQDKPKSLIGFRFLLKRIYTKLLMWLH